MKMISKKSSWAGLAALILISISAQAGSMVTINGAGATFPYPIYSKWFSEYHKANPNIQINYQSIGSGGGIRQVTEKTVDFGATDGPMSAQDLFKVDGKIMHIPTVLGAVVPVFNLKGVGELNLTGEVIADIFLGKITRWSDDAIVKINPGVAIPDNAITVVHRSDGSGTTYCFVDYLSKMSPIWEKKVGRATSVNWPVGLGGKGNEGVSGLVKQMPNSIGYVELIYAEHNNISFAAVKNSAGVYVKGSVASVTEAAAEAAKNMPKDYRVSITNAPGKNAYPISTFTWLLVYEKNSGKNGGTIKEFLRWMIEKGQAMAPELGYAPLPKNVAEMVSKTIERIK